ncbi:MAG TPA: glycosyltransferase family 1 protein, partial [Chloroflexi bacterium]|nr:glycosyltransferase family 1 protein [Chloroflexota bacterium]
MHVALSGWFWSRPDTGSGQYLRQLLGTLAGAHAEARFTLLLPTAPPAPQALATLSNVQVVHLPAHSSALSKVWWEQVRVPRAARRAGATLLHVPYWAAPLRASVPVIVTIHDLIPLLLPAYRGSAAVRFYTALVSATARRARYVLTDSEASRRDIIAHLSLPADRIAAIPLAAAAHYTAASQPEDATVWRALGITPGYILYLGGFDRRKNLETALAAFAQARERVPTARLVVAGKLPEVESELIQNPRRWLARVGLTEPTVYFTGFVPEAQKPALYRGARAFLFPSRYEGFGLPPLEALACGVPVVGSEAASLPEVVGEAGVLTSPDDATGMAEALVRLLTDEKFHALLRQRAHEQAARFTW